MQHNKKKFWLAFPCVIAAIGLFIWFFQWLWNAVLPDVLGVKVISYWQSFGILLISKILFGGLHQAKEKFKRKSFGDDDRELWKQKFESRFCGTEEDREKMKQLWKERFASKFCSQETEPENINKV